MLSACDGSLGQPATRLTMLRRLRSLRLAPLQLRSLPSSVRDICRVTSCSENQLEHPSIPTPYITACCVEHRRSASHKANGREQHPKQVHGLPCVHVRRSAVASGSLQTLWIAPLQTFCSKALSVGRVLCSSAMVSISQARTAVANPTSTARSSYGSWRSILEWRCAASARLKMAVMSFTKSSSTDGLDEFVSGCPGSGEESRTTYKAQPHSGSLHADRCTAHINFASTDMHVRAAYDTHLFSCDLLGPFSSAQVVLYLGNENIMRYLLDRLAEELTSSLVMIIRRDSMLKIMADSRINIDDGEGVGIWNSRCSFRVLGCITQLIQR